MERKSAFELEFAIKGIKINLEFEEGYFDSDEQASIEDFVKNLSREIWIDKSYVECKENKRTSTFIVEDGWNALKDFIVDSDYCRYLNEQNQEVLVDAFAMFARCYIYECLVLKTEHYQHINVMVDPDCSFNVIICKDRSNDWKNYTGKWQTWNFDEIYEDSHNGKCK